MKKLFFLFGMMLLCLNGMAQTPHLDFLGLSMNERLDIFMQKLRGMGFVGKYDEDFSGGAVGTEMKGSYKGKPVKLTFSMARKSKVVSDVYMTLDKPNVTEAEARAVFKTWKQFLVPSPGPLLRIDNKRTHDYTEQVLSKINTDIGQVSLYFGYSKKGGAKKDIHVYINFNDTQNFATLMTEEWDNSDDGNERNEGNQVDQNKEVTQISQFNKGETIIVEPPFPPNEVITIISTFIPIGNGNERGKETNNGYNNNRNEKGNNPKPIPGPLPSPKPHHWGQVKVETDTTDVLIEINGIDFIRHLFFTNDYNKVKELILSTPSLSFKKKEEKKDRFIADHTEGDFENFYMSRKDKKSNNIDVMRITLNKWDEKEIINYLISMGYHETGKEERDILGDPYINRRFSNGDESHYIEFVHIKMASPIKSIIFNRK